MESRQVRRCKERQFNKAGRAGARRAVRRARQAVVRQKQSAREKAIAAGELPETRSLVTLMGRYRDVRGTFSKKRYQKKGTLAQLNAMLDDIGAPCYLHPTRGWKFN